MPCFNDDRHERHLRRLHRHYYGDCLSNCRRYCCHRCCDSCLQTNRCYKNLSYGCWCWEKDSKIPGVGQSLMSHGYIHGSRCLTNSCLKKSSLHYRN